jgi:hypothetical protein
LRGSISKGFALSDPPEKKRQSLSLHSQQLSLSNRQPSPSKHSRHASGPFSPRIAAAPRHILRRVLRARRLLFFAPLLALLWYLHAYPLPSLWARPPEPQCAFMSTVDAFARDLDRMREEFGETPLSRHSSRSKGHTFSDTGHLMLSDDPNAPHPIPTLLTLGEERWASLLASQSQTLSEAVAEYEKRYGRPPPRGFDEWWAFATAHDVVLPDEYDGIHRDLAPFWALPKEELKRRLQAVEDMGEVFILELRNGTVYVDIKEGGLAWGGTEGRANQTAEYV